MKRMTIVTPTKNGGKSLSCNTKDWDNNCDDANFENKCMNCGHDSRMKFQLAAYEDAGLTPEEVAEMARAKDQGRLVVLPCKIGDTVYEALSEWDGTECLQSRFKPHVRERTVTHMMIGGHGRPVVGCNLLGGTNADYFEIGNGAFLTRAEAEAALERTEGKV